MMTTPTMFQAGASWTYRPPAGFEASRIIVGAVLSFEDREQIICCAVTGALSRGDDGATRAVTVPFLAITASALAKTVVAADGEAQLPAEFEPALNEWASDSRGLSAFTVPFEGSLERMIARQMADIAGVDVAAN